jgi:hypothetical protein
MFYNIKDMSGKRINKLVVISLSFTKNGYAHWLCKCDCGNKLIVKGYWLRKGKKDCGCEVNKGKNHYNWKGKNVQYRSLHEQMYKLVPKPINCTFCQSDKKLDLANKSQKYLYTKKDWIWLCKRCHGKYDNGWERKENKWFKTCKGCLNKLEVNTDNFYIRKTGKFVNVCKECSKEKQRLKNRNVEA